MNREIFRDCAWDSLADAYSLKRPDVMLSSDPQPASDPAEAHVQFIAQAQRRLFAFILALVRRAADAEDVLQETNLVLWRKRESYRPGTDFHAWAFEIARLQALAHHARQARAGDPIDADLLSKIAEAAGSESTQYDRREAALHNCLQKLPAEQRDLITRRYQPQAGVRVLAAEQGKTAKAVSEALRRIRERLRECIERTLAAEAQP